MSRGFVGSVRVFKPGESQIASMDVHGLCDTLQELCDAVNQGLEKAGWSERLRVVDVNAGPLSATLREMSERVVWETVDIPIIERELVDAVEVLETEVARLRAARPGS